MELKELLTKLKECEEALKDMGAYGIYMFSSAQVHGGKVAVQMRNKDLPAGNVVYDASRYKDKVIKNVVIGDIAFFTLLDNEEVLDEGALCLYEDIYGALV